MGFRDLADYLSIARRIWWQITMQ